ncbi:hypothetical protein M5K25_000372 [Dendrobium thyrsiflorum]|uniref:Uncharacterized protein n=1 Tax=Dendrobium thyrsiflorum TaxID=117978 RepID=A0ABD0VV66_DENTH
MRLELTSDHIGGIDFGEAPSEPIRAARSPSASACSSCTTTLLKSIPGGITCKCRWISEKLLPEVLVPGTKWDTDDICSSALTKFIALLITGTSADGGGSDDEPDQDLMVPSSRTIVVPSLLSQRRPRSPNMNYKTNILVDTATIYLFGSSSRVDSYPVNQEDRARRRLHVLTPFSHSPGSSFKAPQMIAFFIGAPYFKISDCCPLRSKSTVHLFKSSAIVYLSERGAVVSPQAGTYEYPFLVVGVALVSHPTALEKSAYRRSASPSRTPKKKLLDHPLRHKHRIRES